MNQLVLTDESVLFDAKFFVKGIFGGFFLNLFLIRMNLFLQNLLIYGYLSLP